MTMEPRTKSWRFGWDTPPKTNITNLKMDPWKRRFLLETHHFQGSSRSFFGVVIFRISIRGWFGPVPAVHFCRGYTNPASSAQAGTTLKKPKEPRPDTPAPWKPSTQGDLMSALKVRGMFFFGWVWVGGVLAWWKIERGNDGFHFK